jgi:hypothetical protein
MNFQSSGSREPEFVWPGSREPDYSGRDIPYIYIIIYFLYIPYTIYYTYIPPTFQDRPGAVLLNNFYLTNYWSVFDDLSRF